MKTFEIFDNNFKLRGFVRAPSPQDALQKAKRKGIVTPIVGQPLEAIPKNLKEL